MQVYIMQLNGCTKNATKMSATYQMNVKHAKHCGIKGTIKFESPGTKVKRSKIRKIYHHRQKIASTHYLTIFFERPTSLYLLSDARQQHNTPPKTRVVKKCMKKKRNCFKLSNFIIGTGTYGFL